MLKRYWLTFLLLVCTSNVAMATPDPSLALRAKYASLGVQLQNNQFKRPLVLDSIETPNHLKGDIYAIIDYPFVAVNAELNNPDHWCDVLLLHVNTKYCHAVPEPSGTKLIVNIGKKTPEELTDATRIEFKYSVAAVTPEYVAIVLNAKNGPLGTSDYFIQLEAVALPNAKTFLHLTYSYSMNFAGRMAMQTYLGTIGSNKVGFSIVGNQADDPLEYVGGVRGMVERNTMRYYLAIDAFLSAAHTTPAAQLEERLQSWFTSVERYPRQLHEINRGEYLTMKRAEYLRQQTLQ